MKRIKVIDSHTAGEPTRVVIGGFPDLGKGTMAERLEFFKLRHDKLRSAIVNEPRGNNAIVGALLCEPQNKSCAAGVIFFNNVGFLKMCGHGTIGVIKTLQFLDRIGVGIHKIETPVGIIEGELKTDGSVTIRNVPSYRFVKSVAVEVENFGTIRGDVAWGGNWFFLVENHQFELDLRNLEALKSFTSKIRKALTLNNITAANDEEIDHVELFSKSETADSRNFVLCPGNEYDRSPCGTGTSAKLACLYEDGTLKEGEIWRQESIIGSVFEGQIKIVNGQIIPQISGTAFVNAEIDLILDENDPFCYGI
jgi:4-hydroxyproline epimerase